MNLWVNRIGQLLTLAVALFFLSCHEEVSVLGYKNPNSKFKVSYVELPIASSVMLRDSLRTSNYYYAAEPSRLLVGTYHDDNFGTITAHSATQYFRTTGTPLSSSAVYDSVTMQLQFDLYHYGSTAVTPQMIAIYELEKELKFDSLVNYFNRTSMPGSNLLGSKTFTVNTSDLDNFASSTTSADTVVTINVPLNYAFGQKLFASATKFRDATSTADSTYYFYSEFVKEFKGIVIKSVSGDKVVGFSPAGVGSRIILHYHQADADSLGLLFALTPAVGFNQITADRSGTPLSAVNQYYQDFLQESDSRYIQSGTGILTKLDFTSFYNFVDTIPNILINSAELVIESVEASDQSPPFALVMRILSQTNNRFRAYSSDRAQDSVDITRYRGRVAVDVASALSATGTPSPALIDNDKVFYVAGDHSPLLGYSSSNNSYSTVLSLFCQQLTINTDDRTHFRNFVLYPASGASTSPAFQSGAKSLNRVVFPKSGIKLKIYYTKPLTAQ